MCGDSRIATSASGWTATISAAASVRISLSFFGLR
jgi:hypothetical protein